MSDVTEAAPRVLQRAEHSLSRKKISRNTLKVLYRLDRAGHKAYLVGGGVRDLLLGREPKDFDVGTDARPEQIRRLFRNSRIIGRRFRLVHVYFHGEVVEVSTFRREPDPREQRSAGDDLLITSDNTYGTPREDAFRRDFTINALFYDIADFTVIDYTGGIEDLERAVVRAIGEPEVRFREDPVRMLRACEFAGRLGFVIDRHSQEGIQAARLELEKASPARLTEEIVQLLRSGHAAAAMDWIFDLGLSGVILPEIAAMAESRESGPSDFSGVLAAVDRLVREPREISDIALLAILVVPQVLLRREEIESRRGRPLNRSAVEALVEEIVEPMVSRFTISKVRTQHVELAVVGFLRLCEPRWSNSERIRFTRRPYFEDALTLFEILVEATGEGREVLDVWKQAGHRRASKGPSKEAPKEEEKGRPRRRRPRRRRPRHR